MTPRSFPQTLIYHLFVPHHAFHIVGETEDDANYFAVSGVCAEIDHRDISFVIYYFEFVDLKIFER